MAGRGTSLFLFALMLGSLFSALPTSPSIPHQSPHVEPAASLFQGFTTGENWLDLDNQTIAVPNGFNAMDVYDYSDVGFLINKKKDAAKTIGWRFV